VTVLGPYYGQHARPSELDSDADLEMDALQARVRRLEALLREAQDYVGACDGGCLRGCLGERIVAELAVAVPRG